MLRVVPVTGELSSVQSDVQSDCKLVHQFVYLVLRHCVGWGQQNVTAPLAVDGAAHGVADESVVHSGFFEASMQFEFWIEGGLAGSVLDEFQADEKSAPANVPNVRVVSKSSHQGLFKDRTHLPDTLDQVISFDYLLYSQCCCAGRGMTEIGVPVLEKACSIMDRLVDFMVDHNGADGLVPATQTFGNGDQVAGDAVLLTGKKTAGATHTTHDFIQDQQDAMSVADLTDTLKVSRGWRYCAEGSSNYRFGDEADHILGAEFKNFFLQFFGNPVAIVLLGFPGLPVPVCVARGNVVALDEQRGIWSASPHVAAGCECPEGIAVIALAPADVDLPQRLAEFQEVLPTHFERSFHGLGAAADKIDPAEVNGGPFGQMRGQLFEGVAGEESRVGKWDRIELVLDCLQNVRVVMPQAGNCCTTGGIQVLFAFPIGNVRTFAPGDDGRCSSCVSMKNVAHVLVSHAGVRPDSRKCFFLK